MSSSKIKFKISLKRTIFKAYKNNTSKALLKINARKFWLPKNYFVIPLVVIRQRNLNFLQLLFAHAYITNL